ncbi:MBL fold metallo-hydrolase [Halostella sp. JP-L12]|uniref:MBL fold metallo-hydrolase n=1 Tax=Halostella TaxID=1843185 RepID=UPI000EF7DBE9|nr:MULTISPECIES: MBL fold metallo-hydrolase [Halostella]NHN47472.1 MBL fold metallo-hydrolase [Halostella sp. JP-L12]
MDRIDRVAVPFEGAPGGATNAYVVGTDGALLIDPAGVTDELDAVVSERSVAHVAVTHAHPDHVGGVAAYADDLDATVWCRAGRADRFERATGIAPDATFREGTAIPAVGGVTVIDAPGHAPDHVAFRVGDAALVGDLAVAEGSVAVTAPDGDMRAYFTSLRRLRAAGVARLFPGHGPPIENPRETIARLLSHRRDRERRVAAAVREGARTVDEVLDAAYDKDLAGVRDLAARTVEAHLDKLAVEGRVLRDGDRVRTVDGA